jgi:hypothetical protein
MLFEYALYHFQQGDSPASAVEQVRRIGAISGVSEGACRTFPQRD